MYLLFRAVDQRDLGIIKIVGSWMEYRIGYLPDTHKEIVEYRHINAKIIDEDVAYAWMFMGAYRGLISVRDGTPQNERLQVLQSEEATGTKVKYTLTESDVANTVTLMKEIMRMKLDEVYDKRMVQMNMGVSSLELTSWSQQQTEAVKFFAGETDLPLLQSLAAARGITLQAMAEKVSLAVQNYNSIITGLLSTKQHVESEIKECSSIADCCRLMHNRFEIQMSLAQQNDEGIEYSSRFDL